MNQELYSNHGDSLEGMVIKIIPEQHTYIYWSSTLGEARVDSITPDLSNLTENASPEILQRFMLWRETVNPIIKNGKIVNQQEKKEAASKQETLVNALFETLHENYKKMSKEYEKVDPFFKKSFINSLASQVNNWYNNPSKHFKTPLSPKQVNALVKAINDENERRSKHGIDRIPGIDTTGINIGSSVS